MFLAFLCCFLHSNAAAWTHEMAAWKKDKLNVQLTMGILRPKEQNIHTVYTRLKLILPSEMRLSFGHIIIIEIHGTYNYIKNNLKRGQATTRDFS